jgi:hypothetical protein
MKLSEHFDDIEDFEQLLRDAESQARSEWDQQFVGDINERYEQYGPGMFITEKQIAVLERIVG